MRRQALSLLVENNPGVTSRISGLFSRRGFNIDSFSSGVTADPRYTRITIVASGDEQVSVQGAYYDKDKSTRYTKTGSYECD